MTEQHPKSLWLLAAGARDSKGHWAPQRPTGGLPGAILGQVDLGGIPAPPPPAQKPGACREMGELPRGEQEGGGPPWAASSPAPPAPGQLNRPQY